MSRNDGIGSPILVLGGSGQLGNELIKKLTPFAHIIFPTRGSLDLTDFTQLQDFIRTTKPSAIVNAAAYTAVDKAESEPDNAFLLNAEMPHVLAQMANELKVLLVHYSTDYVFDGQKPEPYLETDITGPVNTYGKSKRQGEIAIMGLASRYLIFRTSWVLGAHGHNFMKTILRLAAERDELRVVGDQYGAPTTTSLIADVTAEILRKYFVFKKENESNHDVIYDQYKGEALSFPYGLYHLTASGQTSWCELARRIVDRMGQTEAQNTPKPKAVRCIKTSEYPTPAHRPANSRLNNILIQSTFGVKLPDWKSGVDELLETIL